MIAVFMKKKGCGSEKQQLQVIRGIIVTDYNIFLVERAYAEGLDGSFPWFVTTKPHDIGSPEAIQIIIFHRHQNHAFTFFTDIYGNHIVRITELAGCHPSVILFNGYHLTEQQAALVKQANQSVRGRFVPYLKFHGSVLQ